MMQKIFSHNEDSKVGRLSHLIIYKITVIMDGEGLLTHGIMSNPNELT